MQSLPQGFLGTRADLFMDVMIVIVAAVPALLALTGALARRGAWRAHKALQTLLTIVFGVVLMSFEVYIRLKGGLDGISAGSSLHQSSFLYGYLAVHLSFAVSSALLWAWLFWLSSRRFPSPPVPGDFSATHRRWGRITLLDMGLTALTGLGLYGLCFVA